MKQPVCKHLFVCCASLFADCRLLYYANRSFAASHPLYVSVNANEANKPDVPVEGVDPPPPPEVRPPEVPPPPLPAAAMSAAAAKSAGAAKKQAGGKTTGLTAADLTTKKKQVSKLFFLGTADKYTICTDVVGTTEFKIITFALSGVLPSEGGFLCTLDEDGHTVKWSRPIDAFLFTMEHLRGVMGEGDFSESHVRVRSFDNVLQSMSQDKVEADASDKYWGKPQEIVFEQKLTGTPVCEAIPYRSPSLAPVVDNRGRRHYQYQTLVVVKIEVAERRRTTSKIKRSNPINIYGIEESSPSIEDEYRRRPPHPKRNYRDWGSSHHGGGQFGAGGSKVTDDTGEASEGSRDY